MPMDANPYLQALEDLCELAMAGTEESGGRDYGEDLRDSYRHVINLRNIGLQNQGDGKFCQYLVTLAWELCGMERLSRTDWEILRDMVENDSWGQGWQERFFPNLSCFIGTSTTEAEEQELANHALESSAIQHIAEAKQQLEEFKNGVLTKLQCVRSDLKTSPELVKRADQLIGALASIKPSVRADVWEP